MFGALRRIVFLWKAGKFSKELSAPTPFSAEDALRQAIEKKLGGGESRPSPKAEALSKFVDLVLTQDYALAVCERFGLTKSDLINGYNHLCKLGLEQVYNGDFLPVMIFVRDLPFEYFCEALSMDIEGEYDHEGWLDFARRVVRYQDGDVSVWLTSKHEYGV